MNEAPETQRHFGRDMWLAAMLVIAGVAIAGASVVQIRAQDRMHLAQAPTPSPTPAESMPGGTRPTTPAPEPATPKPEAQKEGAQPGACR